MDRNCWCFVIRVNHFAKMTRTILCLDKKLISVKRLSSKVVLVLRSGGCIPADLTGALETMDKITTFDYINILGVCL